MKLFKQRTIRLDGTKLHAKALRHCALSQGHIEKLEAPLKGEVQEWLVRAEQSDPAVIPDWMSLPGEIGRRQERFEAMAKTKVKIEARARNVTSASKRLMKPV
jgi:hypothetical protein